MTSEARLKKAIWLLPGFPSCHMHFRNPESTSKKFGFLEGSMLPLSKAITLWDSL